MNDTKVIGLIAGEGRLPFMVAEGAKKAGLKVVCVGLAGSVNESLSEKVDKFYKVAIARPGSWVRKLKRHDVTEAIMVGRVAKVKLFTPWRILRYLPDLLALKTWYWTLKNKDKRNDTILGALADALADRDVILEDSTMYCKEQMAESGVMGNYQPSASIKNDIEFGWDKVKKLGELDIGQAIAVREREVIAVEAIEGTAKMIQRTGQCCKKGGWTLIKTSKPDQDMRFDVPCIGPDTVKSVHKNGGKCIVVEAGKTILIDKDETLRLADKHKISILGHEK